MGRRRKGLFRFRLRLNQKSTRSIAALIFLLFSILSVFSYLGQAAFQTNLQNFLNEFFGVGAILVPVWLFLLGFALTQIKWEIAQPRTAAGFTLLSFSLLALIELFSKEANGGGLLGDFLARNLENIFTTFGAFLICLTLLIISLLIIFNTSLADALEFLLTITTPLQKFINEQIVLQLRVFLEKRKTADRKPAPTETSVEERKIEIKEGSLEPKIEVVHEPTLPDETKMATSTAPLPSSFKEKPPYQPPSLDLLSEPEKVAADRGDIEKNAQIIEKTLGSFGISAKVAEVNLGPAVTQYALDLSEGTKIAKVTALHNDLALALAAPTGMVRIEAPIPGRSLVGVEVPNYSPTLVTLKSLLTSEPMRVARSRLTVALGHNVAGESMTADLARWPHVLIAGSTGSGKSVLLHSMICSLLFRATPNEVKLILVDPKRVELTQYNGIPHLITPVMVDSQKVISAFKWAVSEMEKRYKLFVQLAARNLVEFNEKTDTEKLPFIVIIVDELADLMAFAAAEAETLITRIAQMSRATGIHMILSTQRPSVDVITGLIKANIPARIALNVSSGTDSRVIIDSVGAEKLLGRGDMLYLPPDRAKPIRIQGVFMGNEELGKIIDYLKQFGEEDEKAVSEPTLIPRVLGESPKTTMALPIESEDELFIEALKVIVNYDKASASLLQRRLRMGYARAARLLDEMEERGLISPKDGSNPREVFAHKVSEYLLAQQDKGKSATGFPYE